MSNDIVPIHPDRLAVLTQELHDLEVKAADYIYQMGVRLIEVKEGLEHGDWLNWLSANFAMSPSTAENWMRVARKFQPEFLRTNKIPPGVLYLLASPSAPESSVSAVIDQIQSGVNISKEAAAALIDAAKYIDQYAPDIIKEKVAAGALSLLDAAQLMRSCENISQRVQNIVFRHGVKDPQVIQFLAFLEKEDKALLDEIEATGYLQGSDDEPVKLSEANVRDCQALLGEHRFEDHVRDDIVKSEPVLDADFVITEIDDTGLNFTVRVDTTSSLLREGYTGRLVIKPKRHRK